MTVRNSFQSIKQNFAELVSFNENNPNYVDMMSSQIKTINQRSFWITISHEKFSSLLSGIWLRCEMFSPTQVSTTKLDWNSRVKLSRRLFLELDFVCSQSSFVSAILLQIQSSLGFQRVSEICYKIALAEIGLCVLENAFNRPETEEEIIANCSFLLN